jgi:type I restriction-modification system DNA methylase subunit
MGNRRAGKLEAAASSAAKLGFEGKLWAAANALRGSMDAAEYKHVVLGLIFLASSSNVEPGLRRSPTPEEIRPFEAKMARLVAQLAEQQAEARRLDGAIWKNLKELGYGM